MTNSFTISPHSSEFESSPRWVRVYFNRQLIADSEKVMLLRENNHLPLYYAHSNEQECNTDLCHIRIEARLQARSNLSPDNHPWTVNMTILKT